MSYDAAGRVVREIDPEGHPTSWRYDALGRTLEVTRPQGITVAYEYQDDLDTTTVTYRDALDQETISFYDELGRLVSTTYPDGTMEQMELDANGNAEIIEQANGTVWTQTFDPLNRLATRAIAPAQGVPAPSVETYDFDALGRLANIVRGGIGTQIDYDLLSRPVAETTLGRTVARDYDAIGNPESLGYPSSLALARTFTNLSQLDTITANGAPLADLDWAGQLPRSKQILSGASGATTTWLYDEAERLVGHGTTWGTSGNAKSLVDERLRLDDRGLRVASIREDLGDQGWSYGLDGAGRLTSAQRAVFDAADQPIAESRPQTSSLSSRIEYGYDTAQNLEVRRATGLCGAVEETTMPRDSSGRNRPGSIGDVTLEWDDNGNLVRRGGQTFTYDDRDRLVEVREGGVLIASYTYDAFDRRIRKTVGGRTFETVWDGWRAIEEIETFQDASELLQSRRVYGTGIDEVLRLELRQGNELKSYTPIYDATTSLVALADETGRIVERYEYTPYGERIVRTDLVAPSVEQVRLENGGLVVELSEVVAGDGLESAVLENVTKGTVVPVEWDRPVVEGRRALHRLVIEPQSPDPENPTVEPGDTLRWTLPASALRDSFGNEASLDYVSPVFAWSESTAAIIEDTTPPEILEACVVDRKLRLGFSEPIDAATFSELQVAGVTAWQPTADGYGLESSTALDVGETTLTIGALADLAGQPIASSSSLPVEVKTTPTSVFAAPFEGEQITSTVGNPLGFQGLPLDEETGFYYVRHRYYDPSMGRFTQPDPLEYVDGPSMYAFAMNSPASYSDPLGLFTGTEEDIAAVIQQIGPDNYSASVAQVEADFGRAMANPYFQGSLQVVGGCSEAFAGGAAVLTGVGTVPGAVALAHGTDLCGTGLSTLILGETQETLFVGGSRDVLLKTGMDPGHAEIAVTALDLVVGIAPSVRIVTKPSSIQGFSAVRFSSFRSAAKKLVQRSGFESGQLAVQGSRVSGAAQATSDIDLILRVSPEEFQRIAAARLSQVREGTRLRKTLEKAINKKKLSSFDLGPEFNRQKRELLDLLTPGDIEVDFSVIVEGSTYDTGPFYVLSE